MSDKPPLFFEKRLGGLFPACPAANEAMHAITGRVRIDIRLTRGNARRNGLYWACLSVAAPMLSEKIDGDPLTVNILHKVLKKRAGLVRLVTLPSGDVFEDYDSISFATMAEPDRADFVTWALATLSKWLGCDVTQLHEAADAA